MSVPCQTKWTRAQPIACATGWCKSISTAVIANLPRVTSRFNQPADLGQLLRRRAMRGERLHDELRRRAAERAIEQIPHELALGLLLRQASLIDMRPVRLVAPDEPFLRHDLQQLERRRICRWPFAQEHVVDLPDGRRPALPQQAEDGQFGVGRSWGYVSGHGPQYLRTPS